MHPGQPGMGTIPRHCVVEGKMHEQVQQYKMAVICVYAACGKESAAGGKQQRGIEKLQKSKCRAENRVGRGKCPFTMLLHDLEIVIRQLQGGAALW